MGLVRRLMLDDDIGEARVRSILWVRRTAAPKGRGEKFKRWLGTLPRQELEDLFEEAIARRGRASHWPWISP